MRAEKNERRANRAERRAARRTEKDYQLWRKIPADARCCASADKAAGAGCLNCLRLFLRGTQMLANAAGVWGANPTMALAAREGQTEALLMLLPCTAAWRSGPEGAANAVRDAGLLAASHGHFAATSAALRGLFAANSLPGAWHAPELCDILATDGRAADLVAALELGAAWPRADKFAARRHIFAPSSSRAECCRLAGPAEIRRMKTSAQGMK
jgi:hypothetical protein